MSDKSIPNKYRVISLLLLAVAIIIAVASYGALPDPIPTHWNAAGEIDGWMAKPWGAIVLPLIMAAVWLMFEILSFISPKGFKLNEFIGTVGVLMSIMVGFLLLIYAAQIAIALGYSLPMSTVVISAVGLLFVLMGNYFGKLRKNFFIGIRTPWTLANEEVWYRTHRLAGKLFVAAGVLLLITPWLVSQTTYLVLPVVILAALIPVAYSLWLYKKLEVSD